MGRSWSVSELHGGLTDRNLRVGTTDDGAPADVHDRHRFEVDVVGERYGVRATLRPPLA